MPLPVPVRLLPRTSVPGQGTQELPTPCRICWAMEASATPLQGQEGLQWPTGLPASLQLPLKAHGVGVEGAVGAQRDRMGTHSCIAQQSSESKSSHCGASVSQVAPAGLPRSEIQALGRVQAILSSWCPGQAIRWGSHPSSNSIDQILPITTAALLSKVSPGTWVLPTPARSLGHMQGRWPIYE